jgi:hypothetical protein
MPVLPAAIMMKTDMDYDSIAKAGSMLGSGAVIVMDETTCMVRALERLSYFYFEAKKYSLRSRAIQKFLKEKFMQWNPVLIKAPEH